MGKVILSNMVTLDGFFEGPDKQLDWHILCSEFNEYSVSLLDSADTLLFGRVTYQLMANYWPTPSAITNDPAIAEKMNALPKIVFSKTLPSLDWNNSRLIKGHIGEELSKMKGEISRNLVILGSGSLVTYFTQLGLIDEYRIIISPIILGKGNPLFSNLDKRQNLELIGTKSFKSGIVIIEYRLRK